MQVEDLRSYASIPPPMLRGSAEGILAYLSIVFIIMCINARSSSLDIRFKDLELLPSSRLRFAAFRLVPYNPRSCSVISVTRLLGSDDLNALDSADEDLDGADEDA